MSANAGKVLQCNCSAVFHLHEAREVCNHVKRSEPPLLPELRSPDKRSRWWKIACGERSLGVRAYCPKCQ